MKYKWNALCMSIPMKSSALNKEPGGDTCRDACLPQEESGVQKNESLPKCLKILFTINVYAVFIGFAICRSLYGPTLVELQLVTGASVQQVSMVFTWLGAGGIAGSLTYGWLFDRFPPLVLFLVSMVTLGGLTITLPNCHYLSVLMVVAAAQSFVFTGISVGCNVTIFRLWRSRASPFFLSMHMLYTFGGFMAPILSEPFLSTRPDLAPVSQVDVHHSEDITKGPVEGVVQYGGESTDSNSQNVVVNNSYPLSAHSLPSVLTNSTTPQGSRIYFTYLIVGLYLEAVAVLVLVTILCGKKYHMNLSKGSLPMEAEKPKKLTRFLPWGMFLVLSMLFGGVETMFSGLLFTFANVKVGMSNVQSSLLLSMLFVCYAGGRFAAIFTSQCLAPRYLLTIDIILALGSTSALSYFNTSSVIALWVCTILFSIGASTVFSTTLLWARDFLALTGRFTSTYVIAYTVGMMTWPALTGYLVQKEGASWFPYMNTMLLACFGLSFTILWCIHHSRQKDMSKNLRTQVSSEDKDIIASLHSLRGI